MKKFLRVLLITLCVLTVIVVADITLNKTYKTNYDSLDETDKKMFAELSNIYKEFRENGDLLWSQYKLNEEPLIVVRSTKDRGILKKHSYAINVEDISKGIFAKKMEMPSSLKLPDVYRLSKFDVSTLSTYFLSNFGSVKVRDNDTFYFKYYPKMMENPELYFDFSSFLLHESFHTYKQKEWTYDKNDAEYINNYPLNEENYALMGLEFTLLDKCMASNDISVVKDNLKDWTMVRSYRLKKWPQLIGETKTEAIEGAARYIEYKYSDLTGGHLTVLANKEAPYYVTFMQAYGFIANNKAESPEYLKRPMRYEIGAALGLNMDKIGIDWKQEIEDSEKKHGRTQYEILKEYFNINDSDITDEKISTIKDSNNYHSLLDYGKKLVELVNKKEQ